jgi:hypothetical protein
MKALWGAAVMMASACGGAEAASPTSAAPDNKTAPEAAGSTVVPEVGAARADFDRAENQVGAATGDCAAACRALASMQRAADHLCSVDGGPECARARQRVDTARERVQASCGQCPL